jgi:hypothetical protein
MEFPNVKYMKRKGEYRVADGPANAKTLEVLLEGQKVSFNVVLLLKLLMISSSNFDLDEDAFYSSK